MGKVKRDNGPAKTKKDQILKVKNGDPKSEVKGVKKTPMKSKPVSNKTKEAIKNARLAIATGELAQSEIQRKKDQDSRTLYLRFKEDHPSSDTDVRALHPGIKHVRIPRQAKIKGKTSIKYAFVEFASEKDCLAAKNKFASNSKLYVDFVGDKSKNSATGSNKKSSNKKPINPVRLFINGLGPGITEETLKKLFPKCKEATIPQKKKKSKNLKFNTYGFVEFHNPADAKAAFDASKDINVDGHHIVVLYARINKKRKLAEEKKSKEDDSSSPAKKQKVEKAQNDKKRKRSDSDEGDDDENDEDEEAEMEVENDEDDSDNDDEEGGEEVENDDDDDDDDDADDDDDNEDAENDEEDEDDDNEGAENDDDDDDDEEEGDDDDDEEGGDDNDDDDDDDDDDDE